MREGDLILGDPASAQSRIFRRCRQSHAIGLSDGTAAEHLSLRALGVGPGDEVITTPMSWLATGNAILALGAMPVFADVTDDFNVDPAAVEAAVTSRTKAILPVHFMAGWHAWTRLSPSRSDTLWWSLRPHHRPLGGPRWRPGWIVR